MVCVGLTGMECSVLLASQQDAKLFFIIFYFAAFIFIWYFFTKKRIDDLKLQYLVWPVLTAKWSGFIYFLFSPVHFLLFISNVNYEVALGWFALFYIPTVLITLLMPILMLFDRFFIYMGYESLFQYLKKYKERLI